MNHKLRITFRSPDAVDTARAKFHEDNRDFYDSLTEDELDEYLNKFYDILNNYVSYRDSITIELDVETMTSRVVPQDEKKLS